MNIKAVPFGNKMYELSNHLGNVMAVVSDKKLTKDTNNDGIVDGYLADIKSYSDYYPFGMQPSDSEHMNTKNNNNLVNKCQGDI